MSFRWAALSMRLVDLLSAVAVIALSLLVEFGGLGERFGLQMMVGVASFWFMGSLVFGSMYFRALVAFPSLGEALERLAGHERARGWRLLSQTSSYAESLVVVLPVVSWAVLAGAATLGGQVLAAMVAIAVFFVLKLALTALCWSALDETESERLRDVMAARREQRLADG